MNLRQPFGRYFRLSESEPQVNDRVQRSIGMKFCARCGVDRPALGSKNIGANMFQCAIHGKPKSDLSDRALRLVNPVSGA